MNIDLSIDTILSGLRKKKGVQTCTPPLAAPSRDWQILLSVLALLFIGAAVFAVYTYRSVVDGPVEGSTVASSQVRARLLDEAALSRVLQLSDLRVEQRREYLRGL